MDILHILIFSPYLLCNNDAYTYVFRGKVFANAQTGNIVLLSQNICERNWLQSAHYFVPLAAFAIGIIVAEQIRGKYQNVQNHFQ